KPCCVPTFLSRGNGPAIGSQNTHRIAFFRQRYCLTIRSYLHFRAQKVRAWANKLVVSRRKPKNRKTTTAFCAGMGSAKHSSCLLFVSCCADSQILAGESNGISIWLV